MTKRQPRFNRCLRCECLEPRRLLAGDVSVNVNNAGHLIISGDDLSNAIQVEAGLLPGQYVITGILDQQSVGTTVNGVSSVTVSGVTGDVNIQLRAGDDWLDFGMGGPINVAGDLKINTDGGSDVINIFNLNVAGSLAVLTGDTEDSLAIVDSTVGGGVGILMGAGHDSLALQNVTVLNGDVDLRLGDGFDQCNVGGQFGHNLTIVAGAGFDNVNLTSPVDINNQPVTRTFVGGDVTISLGADGDTFGTLFADISGGLYVTGAGGNDLVTISGETIITGAANISTGADLDGVQIDTASDVLGGLTILTGGEDDQVAIVECTISSDVFIGTGAGTDWVGLFTATFNGTLTIDTGAGSDTVDSEGSVFDEAVAIMLGSGDDQLILLDSSFGDAAILDGGSGSDTYTDLGGNSFDITPIVQRFEV